MTHDQSIIARVGNEALEEFVHGALFGKKVVGAAEAVIDGDAGLQDAPLDTAAQCGECQRLTDSNAAPPDALGWFPTGADPYGSRAEPLGRIDDDITDTR